MTVSVLIRCSSLDGLSVCSTSHDGGNGGDGVTLVGSVSSEGGIVRSCWLRSASMVSSDTASMKSSSAADSRCGDGGVVGGGSLRGVAGGVSLRGVVGGGSLRGVAGEVSLCGVVGSLQGVVASLHMSTTSTMSWDCLGVSCVKHAGVFSSAGGECEG